MNILIMANHYAVASGRYAMAAFRALGHKVCTVGPEHGRNIWGLQVANAYTWEPSRPGAGWVPDFVLLMDSDPDLLDTAGKLFDCPVYVWGVDNHVRDYRRGYIKHYFLAHRGVSVMPWAVNVHGVCDMTHLPCAYGEGLHTPSRIPYLEREYDVCMIGVMYPQRWEMIHRLRNAGVKVLAGTGLVYGDYVAAYHNSRIALNLSIAGDVAQRVFETAAMGNVVVSDKCADFALLKPDGFWLIDDPATIEEEVKVILSDPAKAQEMIERSLAWVKPHTWDARAQVIIDWHGERTND